MTEKELFQEFGIRISVFDNEIHNADSDEAFYISSLKTMFISSKIPPEDRIKITFHELGHKDHLTHLYSIFREKYEAQANRNMIHYLMKAELDECEDKEYFNYLDFMKKYKLKTIADETMVKEEYLSIINHIKGIENEF